jgi:hypothetical protein
VFRQALDCPALLILQASPLRASALNKPRRVWHLALDTQCEALKLGTSRAYWTRDRRSDFLERHLIPNEPDLWEVEALPDFVKAREQLIRQRLRRLSLDPIVRENAVEGMKETDYALGK